ncbi:hypothetical protein M8J77_018032 [Diaphorina citri]|nr:hypothetical protein M8J77_018032 [Diaphorina citri]
MKPTPQQVFRSNVNRPKKKKKVINDESIMNVAMTSSANDLVHVSELLTSGTKEIQDVLKHECMLIYECKVCRGLFRSIINFVIHKRKYCVNKFSAVNQQDLSSKLSQVEALFRTTPSTPDIENGKVKPMRTIQPPNLSSFYHSLISKTLGSVSPDGKGVTSNDILKMQSATVLLDKLETTQFPQIVADNPELTSFINDSSTAILREDGTIATNIKSLGELYKDRFASVSVPDPVSDHSPQVNGHAEPSEKLNLQCSLCKYSCTIRSSLYKHLQEKHFTLYKCDQCNKNYHSVRSVTRHLHEVHHISRARVEQVYKKKVIASKVVKSVPKHLYTQNKPKPIETVTPAPTIPVSNTSNKLSSCVKCSGPFNSISGSVLCLTCTISSDSSSASVKSDEVYHSRDHQVLSPAKYLIKFPLQGCSNKIFRSPASSCAGDIPSPGSPVIPRLSIEENRNKAGIQVRMNYDKCSPGNPIVSKIETPVNTTEEDKILDTPTLSPSSDSVSTKENAHMNGDNISNVEKENQLGSKDKRKNLDSITQKLLNSKMGDESCRNIKLTCSPLLSNNNKILDMEHDRSSRKSTRRSSLDILLGNKVKTEVPTKPDDIPTKEQEDNSEVEDKPKRRTRQNSVENKTVSVDTRCSQTLSRNETRLSMSKKRDTLISSSKSIDGKTIVVKEEGEEPVKSNEEPSKVSEPQSNGLDHTASEQNMSTEVNLKRKLRTRTETIVNKKSKPDQDLTVNSTSDLQPLVLLDNSMTCDTATESEVVPASQALQSVPPVLRGSGESLEDLGVSSDNERLFKSLMKDAMDISPDSYQCRLCTISFPPIKKLLRIHVASKHLGYFRYRCAVESCAKMYFSHSDATQHASTSHANQNSGIVQVDANTLSMSAALEAQTCLKEKQKNKSPKEKQS